MNVRVWCVRAAVACAWLSVGAYLAVLVPSVNWPSVGQFLGGVLLIVWAVMTVWEGRR